MLLFVAISHRPVLAIPPAEASDTINDAAAQLIQFCIEPESNLDERAVSTLIDYVLSAKEQRELYLPKSSKSPGAYIEFDTKISFPRFMEYSYNPLIPSVITRPSSLRYSFWADSRGKPQKLPAILNAVPSAGKPVIIRGMQRDSNTPDLNTGVYHEYDLKRTLILANHRGRQVLISVSKQINTSGVGKKGAILGNDNNWTYFYSGKPGTAKTGLGWVKSYIYDYFSIAIFVESGTTPATVRTGIFQWLRAGWTGINFVKPAHILGGMKRFAYNTKAVLESPRLPAPHQIASVYQLLLSSPTDEVVTKYTALQRALRIAAFRAGKINKSESEEHFVSSDTQKEQMVEELMLEYLRKTLAKPTLLKEPIGLSKER